MRPASRRFPAAVALAWAALACAPSADTSGPRVVSLAPQGTRALAVLELPHRLVAVDAESLAYLTAPLPIATLDTALSHRPDLVLIPPAAPQSEAAVERIRRSGATLVEIAPHQLGDAFALYHELAFALGDEARGRAVSLRIGDALGRMSVRNLGRRRPRVAVLASLDPLVLAGGHSFESDVVELAGAETTTHGDEVPRVPASVDAIRAAAPELVWVAAAPPDDGAQAVVRGWFAPARVAFVPIDADALWLDGALDTPVAIQALVDELRERSD